MNDEFRIWNFEFRNDQAKDEAGKPRTWVFRVVNQ